MCQRIWKSWYALGLFLFVLGSLGAGGTLLAEGTDSKARLQSSSKAERAERAGEAEEVEGPETVVSADVFESEAIATEDGDAELPADGEAAEEAKKPLLKKAAGKEASGKEADGRKPRGKRTAGKKSSSTSASAKKSSAKRAVGKGNPGETSKSSSSDADGATVEAELSVTQSKEAKTAARLPRYFAKLGLTEDQRSEVLEVVAEYEEMLDELEARAVTLKAERDMELRKKLAVEQRRQLEELAKPRSPSTESDST